TWCRRSSGAAASRSSSRRASDAGRSCSSGPRRCDCSPHGRRGDARIAGMARLGRAIAALLCVAFGAIPCGAAEGVKVEVHIDGLSKEMEHNVESSLSLASAARAGKLSEAEVQRLFVRAPEEVARALEPFGYYRPQLRDTLEPGEKKWHARFVVDPGPPLLLDSVTVVVSGEGSSLPRLRPLVSGFPLNPAPRALP